MPTEPMATDDHRTATLTRVCTYKRWTQIAAKEYGFFPGDVDRLSAVLSKGAEESGYFQLRLAGLNRRTVRYRSKNGSHLIVTSIGQNQFLTRSSKARLNKIVFAVAEEHRPGCVTPLFEWKLQGPCLTNFEHYLSCAHRFVLICGPNDEIDAHIKIPSTRLIERISSDAFHAYHLNLRFKDRSQVWPMSAAFHPEQESLCAMVCSSTKTNSLPRDKNTGYLALYDTDRKTFVDALTHFCVSSSLLKFICGGTQIIVGDEEGMYPSYRSLLIFASAGLQLLHRIPVLPTCTISSVIVLYTPDFRRLALVLNRRKPRFDSSPYQSLNDVNGNNHSAEDKNMSENQVAVYNLRIQDQDIGLATLACGAVCKYVRPSDFQVLPLPRALIDELSLHSRRL
ncbi:hypothetical protein CAPTEDRAFT_193115 [Capitella teleta]|uniref:SOCS box domain-containing protein n=1 Tax=Capitella teleta TaxID=283909 RepID=R7UWI3_CAPTE|nr:hypothetical protein CAPTEDRAFT_193115 [Capitella teleta]|eukprot:ELU07746.1 hypothetical protein CAPTEDRAFT_193115 [Capitella teleta]